MIPWSQGLKRKSCPIGTEAEGCLVGCASAHGETTERMVGRWLRGLSGPFSPMALRHGESQPFTGLPLPLQQPSLECSQQTGTSPVLSLCMGPPAQVCPTAAWRVLYEDPTGSHQPAFQSFSLTAGMETQSVQPKTTAWDKDRASRDVGFAEQGVPAPVLCLPVQVRAGGKGPNSLHSCQLTAPLGEVALLKTFSLLSRTQS